MKLNSTGIAGISLVLAAVLGGAAGGALVLSDDSSPTEAPRPAELGISTTEETDLPPVEAPSPAPSPSSIVAPSAPEQEPATVTKPAPKPAEESEPQSPAEPAAEPAAEAPEPTPAPAPEPTPVPECIEGEKEGIPYNGNNVGGGQGGERTCINGKWVVTKEPVDAPPSAT